MGLHLLRDKWDLDKSQVEMESKYWESKFSGLSFLISKWIEEKKLLDRYSQGLIPTEASKQTADEKLFMSFVTVIGK